MVEKLAIEDSASFITQLDEAVDAILNEIYICFIHKDATAEPEGNRLAILKLQIYKLFGILSGLIQEGNILRITNLRGA